MNCFGSSDVCGATQDFGVFLPPSPSTGSESDGGVVENDYVCMDGSHGNAVQDTENEIKDESSSLDVQLDLGDMALDLKKVTSFRYVILY